ncbi:hypothetical protein LTR84_008168 [Exophiala bonariae]|uniref:GED domain-containing protein n=1 Tax=Exophiala bonariae TaxID=1690606 RepID=A0AAV9MYJ9_9EURO|nr:hypothetical protein LTR84_008168 [Exophiala bonariae]
MSSEASFLPGSFFSASSAQSPKTPEKTTTPLSQPQVHLQTQQHDELLDLIDTLRSQGIPHYIDLPQLIVCGDQSAGKSSVLEAISGGLRFPTKDSLCTRFAIEIILRRSPTSLVTIAIIPDAKRSRKEKESLTKFQPPTVSLEAFPDIIDAAAKAMGIDGTYKSFSNDVLRVELSGPTQPHLTLVDLPGLYHAGNEHQSWEEAEAIHTLVKSYMKKERSIILAVVSAMNDYSNQIVTEYARMADPKFDRTLGIITKPDTLHSGSSALEAFQSLIIGHGTQFKLGWNALRNRDYKTRNSSTEERDKAEDLFFQGDDWKGVPKHRLGIKALRKRLSEILFTHILKELPQLVQDVHNGITKCEERLKGLGASRRTLEEQRKYLAQISQAFARLMQASIDGTYSAAFFGSSEPVEGYNKRLRAVVQNILGEFAQRMRLQGHRVTLVDYVPSQEDFKSTVPTPTHRDVFLEYVKGRLNRNRGTELPGTFNPAIIGDLFYDQAQPWSGILQATRANLLKATEATIDLVLEHVTNPATARAIQLYVIQPNMKVVSDALAEKANEVLRPHLHGRPLTFNHYFIDNIQKKRREETRKNLATKLNAFLGKDPEAKVEVDRIYEGKFNVRALLDSLVLKTEVDFERFACVEATNAMEAYYKVALKTVIDAFGMYAVEGALLGNLPTVFNPDVVGDLDEEMITKVASESSESIAEREDLEKQLSTLEKSLKALQQIKIRQIPDVLQSKGGERDQSANLTAEDPAIRAKRSSSTASRDSGIGIGLE